MDCTPWYYIISTRGGVAMDRRCVLYSFMTSSIFSQRSSCPPSFSDLFDFNAISAARIYKSNQASDLLLHAMQSLLLLLLRPLPLLPLLLLPPLLLLLPLPLFPPAGAPSAPAVAECQFVRNIIHRDTDMITTVSGAIQSRINAHIFMRDCW